jgi:hypothetical protein
VTADIDAEAWARLERAVANLASAMTAAIAWTVDHQIMATREGLGRGMCERQYGLMMRNTKQEWPEMAADK